jgi:hypothetical protein
MIRQIRWRGKGKGRPVLERVRDGEREVSSKRDANNGESLRDLCESKGEIEIFKRDSKIKDNLGELSIVSGSNGEEEESERECDSI